MFYVRGNLMIKVKIKPELLEKHRKYLLSKKIDELLREFQRNTSFFEIDYLNKLVDANKKKKYSCHKFFSREITLKKRKKLLKQHFEFMNYLIQEVDDLEKCEDVSECNNLFLVSPEGLSKKKKDIERNYIYIYMNFLAFSPKYTMKMGKKRKHHMLLSLEDV